MEDGEGVSVWWWHVICCYRNRGCELCPVWTSAEARGDVERLRDNDVALMKCWITSFIWLLCWWSKRWTRRTMNKYSPPPSLSQDLKRAGLGKAFGMTDKYMCVCQGSENTNTNRSGFSVMMFKRFLGKKKKQTGGKIYIYSDISIVDILVKLRPRNHQGLFYL